jgi:type I restriction enzyme S subunit
VSNDLPTLPKGWSYEELEDLIEPGGVSYGIVQPGHSVQSGVPIVRVNNLHDGRIATEDVLRVSAEVEANYSRTRLKGGEVLLSLVGSVGEVTVVPHEMAGWNVARAIAVIRPSERVANYWLKHWLRSPFARRFMHMWQTTTVQATLNLRDVRRLPVAMPPQLERRAIAEVLNALDDKIDINERLYCLCHDLASGLLARVLDAAESAGTSEKRRLGDVAQVNARKTAPGVGMLRYLDISSVGVGRADEPTEMEWAAAPGRARRAVKDGDVLWSTVRPNRRSHCLLLDPEPDLVVSTGFAVLTPVSIGPSFLYGVTERSEFVDYLVSVAEGSAYPAVRAERFSEALVPLPSRDALASFEESTMPLRRYAGAVLNESRKLVALRDTLLPPLLSGELRVRDAEALVGEAA